MFFLCRAVVYCNAMLCSVLCRLLYPSMEQIFSVFSAVYCTAVHCSVMYSPVPCWPTVFRVGTDLKPSSLFGRGFPFLPFLLQNYSFSGNVSRMKKDIHGTFFVASTATCACGKEYTVGSTMEKINVEICAACHPFYTGQDKVLDTAGRVDKFKKRAAAMTDKKASVKK